MSENTELKNLDIISLITDFHIFDKKSDEIKERLSDYINKDTFNLYETKKFIWNEKEFHLRLLFVGKKLTFMLVLPTVEDKNHVKELKDYLSNKYQFSHNDKRTLWEIDNCSLNICKERKGNGYQVLIWKDSKKKNKKSSLQGKAKGTT